jgi:hypothetical protein
MLLGATSYTRLRIASNTEAEEIKKNKKLYLLNIENRM